MVLQEVAELEHPVVVEYVILRTPNQVATDCEAYEKRAILTPRIKPIGKYAENFHLLESVMAISTSLG